MNLVASQAEQQHALILEPQAISENKRAEIRLTPYSRQLTSGGGKPGQGYPCVFEPCYTRNGRGAPDSIVPPLKAQSGQTGKGDGAPVVAFDWQAGGGGHDDSFRGKSRSYIVRKGGYAQLRKNATDAVMGNFGVRRLMPLECERLQGFPDGWTAVDGMSDSARYRMLGNAVAVPVAEWIGRRIVLVESMYGAGKEC